MNLYWFAQEQALKRGISLDADLQQANLNFCDYMRCIRKQPYAVQAVAFWSIEQAYCQVYQQDQAQLQLTCTVCRNATQGYNIMLSN